MTKEFLILLQQMKLFLILIIAGALAQKLKLLSDDDIDGFAQVNIRVMTPIMLITVISQGNRSEIGRMMPFFLCAFLSMSISLSIAYLSGRLLRLKQPTRNIHMGVTGLGNAAMVGYPLLLSIFPDSSALAIAVYAIADSCVVWTAVPILADPSGKADFKRIINPITISAFIGVLIMLLDIKPDNIVWNTLTEFGLTIKYACLLYIGMDISRKGLKKILGRLKVLSVIPIKLIITPLTIFFIINSLGVLSHELMMMISIMSMTPSVMCITMVARTTGSDDNYATGAMITTTLASLVTIPVVMHFIGL
ncbi:MAG: AEC family transporter [Lachnospiraceae bacterium]|nr:AEC family transporter [Lachnospiraceae bacterium]